VSESKIDNILAQSREQSGKLSQRFMRAVSLLMLVSIINLIGVTAILIVVYGWKPLIIFFCFGINAAMLGHCLTQKWAIFPRYHVWRAMAFRVEQEFEQRKAETGVVDYTVDVRVVPIAAPSDPDSTPTVVH
jgi:hypothetical protein